MHKVKMIAATKPMISDPITGYIPDISEFVAYVARVSNPSNQNNHLSAGKLLKYLAKHKHWSPFEMVDVIMEIETTRDIAHQIVRHRSFSFQEFSQRYADPTKDLGFVTREARLQDEKNRQNSIETENLNLQLKWHEMQTEVALGCEKVYKWAVENGVAKEQARAVLPEGLTSTRLYMKGSLRSWIHYCQVRMDPSTQKEHREIAKTCWNEILTIFPSLSEITAN